VSLDVTGQAIGALAGKFDPKWILTDSAEGLIVTSITAFESSIENLVLSIDAGPPISVSDLLCLGRNKDHGHAKLRMEPPKGTIEGHFPLAILDGGKAFSVHEHINAARNVLIILERSEYVIEVHDIAKSLKSISQDFGVDFADIIPLTFTPGIEVAAYLIEEL
jgi:hypothetical protein